MGHWSIDDFPSQKPRIRVHHVAQPLISKDSSRFVPRDSSKTHINSTEKYTGFGVAAILFTEGGESRRTPRVGTDVQLFLKGDATCVW